MSGLIFPLIVGMVVSFSLFICTNTMVGAIVNHDRYWSVLTGDQMVPPVRTDAMGYVGLKYPDDMSKMVYTVNAENIVNVTGIYFYLEDKNQSGTVVLDFLKAEKDHKSNDAKIVNITSEGKTFGTLSVGGATENDLQGRLKGKSIADLHELMVDGKIYISINTKDLPNGEIRGNSFVGMHRLFPDDTDIKWK